jgi:hypothetical protein
LVLWWALCVSGGDCSGNVVLQVVTDCGWCVRMVVTSAVVGGGDGGQRCWGTDEQHAERVRAAVLAKSGDTGPSGGGRRRPGAIAGSGGCW